METANINIQNFASALAAMANNVSGVAVMLNDNMDENAATIRTLNVQIESVRSELVILQNAVDSYPKP